MLTVVEKVISLQSVDIFSEVSTEQLSHLALIANEVNYEAEAVIFEEADPSDSLYLVLDGRVRLHRQELDVTVAAANGVFGTWALFDDEPGWSRPPRSNRRPSSASTRRISSTCWLTTFRSRRVCSRRSSTDCAHSSDASPDRVFPSVSE